MSEQFNYKSVLSGHMKRFVEMKEAAGYNLLRTKWILKEFDDYAVSVNLDMPHITKELIGGWRKTRTNDCERTIYAKYSVWNQLSSYMNRCGAQCFMPKLPKQPKSDFTPYIFTTGQMHSLFMEIDNTRMTSAHMNVGLFSLPALFRLLYSTGVRVSEALSIKNEDVKLSEHCILVKKTKNKVERLVPVCDSLVAVLQQYESYRNRMPISNVSAPSGLYFIKPDGTGLGEQNVLSWFKRTYQKCGIPYMGNHHGPRVHDVRHTHSCHALEQMAQAKMDIYAALPILSCELGHKSLAASEQYVRLTKALYPEISGQCAELGTFVFPKIDPGG